MMTGKIVYYNSDIGVGTIDASGERLPMLYPNIPNITYGLAVKFDIGVGSGGFYDGHMIAVNVKRQDICCDDESKSVPATWAEEEVMLRQRRDDAMRKALGF